MFVQETGMAFPFWTTINILQVLLITQLPARSQWSQEKYVFVYCGKGEKQWAIKVFLRSPYWNTYSENLFLKTLVSVGK